MPTELAWGLVAIGVEVTAILLHMYIQTRKDRAALGLSSDLTR